MLPKDIFDAIFCAGDEALLPPSPSAPPPPSPPPPPLTTIVILRGLPGSGKSTAAKSIESHALARGWGCSVISADDHFLERGVPDGRDHGENPPKKYAFDASRLAEAHASCIQKAHDAVRSSAVESPAPPRRLVVVDNTNIARKHYAPYETLAADAASAVDGVIFLEVALAGGRWVGGDDEEGLVAFCTSNNTHNVPRHGIETMAARWEPDGRARRLLLPFRGPAEARLPVAVQPPAPTASQLHSSEPLGGADGYSTKRPSSPAVVLTASSTGPLLCPRAVVDEPSAVAALLADHRIFGAPVGARRVAAGSATAGAVRAMEVAGNGDGTQLTPASTRTAATSSSGMPVLFGPEATLFALAMRWLDCSRPSLEDPVGGTEGGVSGSGSAEIMSSSLAIGRFVADVTGRLEEEKQRPRICNSEDEDEDEAAAAALPLSTASSKVSSASIGHTATGGGGATTVASPPFAGTILPLPSSESYAVQGENLGEGKGMEKGRKSAHSSVLLPPRLSCSFFCYIFLFGPR